MTAGTTSFTVVVDDRPARAGLVSAHGFACWIERGDVQVLFDTGPDGDVLRHNLASLGKELAFLDAVVVSHGHADHGGGLEWLLTHRRDLPVYLHVDATDGHYAGGCNAGFTPEACRLLHRADLHLVDAWEEVVPGIAVTGPVPRRNDFERIPSRFTRDPEGLVPDLLLDDLSLVVDTAPGAVVVTGCAHAGLVNILDHVEKRYPHRRIHGFLGGTHLVGADAARLRATAVRLDGMDPGLVAPCHCSGEGIAFLQAAFPEAFRPVGTGTCLAVDGG